MKLALAAGFLACILAANYVTTEYGMVPVGFGLMATAGTYFAGLTFVLRDAVQDSVRKLIPARRERRTITEPVYPEWAAEMAPQVRGLMRTHEVDVEVPRSDWLAVLPVLALILAGAALSYFISDPFIALASGVAFAASETADALIYTPLRRKGYARAAVASNVVGAFVDTVLFLWIAGFPIADAIAGQMVGKILITLAVVLAVVAVRAYRRKR